VASVSLLSFVFVWRGMVTWKYHKSQIFIKVGVERNYYYYQLKWYCDSHLQPVSDRFELCPSMLQTLNSYHWTNICVLWTKYHISIYIIMMMHEEKKRLKWIGAIGSKDTGFWVKDCYHLRFSFRFSITCDMWLIQAPMWWESLWMTGMMDPEWVKLEVSLMDLYKSYVRIRTSLNFL
jgi:hypothetical protein